MVIGSGKERRVKTGESGKREIGRRRERDRDIEREREVSAVCSSCSKTWQIQSESWIGPCAAYVSVCLCVVCVCVCLSVHVCMCSAICVQSGTCACAAIASTWRHLTRLPLCPVLSCAALSPLYFSLLPPFTLLSQHLPLCPPPPFQSSRSPLYPSLPLCRHLSKRLLVQNLCMSAAVFEQVYACLHVPVCVRVCTRVCAPLSALCQ